MALCVDLAPLDTLSTMENFTLLQSLSGIIVTSAQGKVAADVFAHSYASPYISCIAFLTP